jgi:hypothetical protein
MPKPSGSTLLIEAKLIFEVVPNAGHDERVSIGCYHLRNCPHMSTVPAMDW